MIGIFHDDHPRVKLRVPGLRGPTEIEFIADTGFAGDLALPYRLLSELDVLRGGPQEYMLANGQPLECASYEIMLDWFEDQRPTEILALEGEPLLGTVLMREHLLQVEMSEGGKVAMTRCSPDRENTIR